VANIYTGSVINAFSQMGKQIKAIAVVPELPFLLPLPGSASRELL